MGKKKTKTREFDDRWHREAGNVSAPLHGELLLCPVTWCHTEGFTLLKAVESVVQVTRGEAGEEEFALLPVSSRAPVHKRQARIL